MTKGENFNELVKFIKSIVSIGYDVCIAISGPEQSGKSTLAIKLIMALQDGKIDLVKNIGYTIGESLKEIPDLPFNGCYMLDEAIRAMYKQDWQKGENKELKRIFAQVGMKKAVFIFNIPNFMDLDRYYRHHRVRIWLRVLGNRWDREKNKPTLFYGVALLKDDADNNPDPWFLSTTWKEDRKSILEKKMSPMFFTDGVNEKLERLERNPCFKWSFTYSPLNDDMWAKYKELSDKRKMEKEDIVIGDTRNKDMINRLIYNLHEKEGFKQSEIAKLTALGPLNELITEGGVSAKVVKVREELRKHGLFV